MNTTNFPHGMGFSIRLLNCLRNEGLTFDHLVNLMNSDDARQRLMRVPNFGKRTWDELDEFFRLNDLYRVEQGAGHVDLGGGVSVSQARWQRIKEKAVREAMTQSAIEHVSGLDMRAEVDAIKADLSGHLATALVAQGRMKFIEETHGAFAAAKYQYRGMIEAEISRVIRETMAEMGLDKSIRGVVLEAIERMKRATAP